jgi:hypothetical protein
MGATAFVSMTAIRYELQAVAASTASIRVATTNIAL